VLQGLLLDAVVAGRGAGHADRAAAIRECAVSALREASRNQQQDSSTALATRVAQMLEETSRAPLDLRAIARRLGKDPTVLRRSFRSAFGMTIRQYHVQLRVRAAIRLLQQPEAKVSAVAEQVGYRSEKNFYRAVRVVTGKTPAHFSRTPNDP
jgi:AraC-like DNA-binding protein